MTARSATAADADLGFAARGRSTNWSGWINVVVAAVVMLATLPGRTQGLGLITEPMLRDLQLDRVAYANINLWATLLGAAICLPVGRVFDRVGLRVTTAILTIVLSVVVWSMSQSRRRRPGAVSARAGDACGGAECAVRCQHHRSREVLRQACRRGHGDLFLSAQRLLRAGLRGRREFGPHQRLAGRMGASRPRSHRRGRRRAVVARAAGGSDCRRGRRVGR